MKIATWNVNGIRAREAQLCEWMARDEPDVVSCQEIKARPTSTRTCRLADYHAFWQGPGYSGVSLHLRGELLEDPAVAHPALTVESASWSRRSATSSSRPSTYRTAARLRGEARLRAWLS